MLALVVDHPQAHPIGVEQAASPVGDVAQHRAELQLPGQLTGDAGQGAGAGELTAGAGDGAGMAERDAGRRGGRAQEASATANPRSVDVVRGQQHADPLLAEGQRQPDAAVGGDVLAIRRPDEGRGRRGAVTGMGLQHEPVVAHEIHRHPGDGLDRAQRLDGDPADGGHAARIHRALRDAGEDGRLDVRVAPAGARAGRGILLIGGGRTLGQQTFDVRSTIAAVSTGIDPPRGQPAVLGPRPDRVRVDAEQGSGLRHADERVRPGSAGGR